MIRLHIIYTFCSNRLECLQQQHNFFVSLGRRAQAVHNPVALGHGVCHNVIVIHQLSRDLSM